MNPSLVKWLEIIRDYSGKMMGIELTTEDEEESLKTRNLEQGTQN